IKYPNIKEATPLEENIELSKRFDAEIISVYDDDIARQISEYSSLSNFSKIVVGKNKDKKKLKEEIFEAVAKKAPNSDLYLVNEHQTSPPTIRSKKGFDFLRFLKITGVLLLATFIA
ncbi:sensor histidine kinase KdpD, partial [Campylobacter jejuni]|nr:sensor histidine kinase KdpD [Campylobacter jejuni]